MQYIIIVKVSGLLSSEATKHLGHLANWPLFQLLAHHVTYNFIWFSPCNSAYKETWFYLVKLIRTFQTMYNYSPLWKLLFWHLVYISVSVSLSIVSLYLWEKSALHGLTKSNLWISKFEGEIHFIKLTHQSKYYLASFWKVSHLALTLYTCSLLSEDNWDFIY